MRTRPLLLVWAAVGAAAVLLASPASAVSERISHGADWGRVVGDTDGVILACDAEADGNRVFTQYVITDWVTGRYIGTWEAWDTNGANHVCAAHDWSDSLYAATSLRVCETSTASCTAYNPVYSQNTPNRRSPSLGSSWGRVTGSGQDVILACDGDPDGVRVFTQYLVRKSGDSGFLDYWEVWDTDGANKVCAAHDWTDAPYYTTAFRLCRGSVSTCTAWVCLN